MNQPVFEQPGVQTAARESAAYLSARYAWYNPPTPYVTHRSKAASWPRSGGPFFGEPAAISAVCIYVHTRGREARALLLSIDPRAALAETPTQLHQRLVELTPTDSPDLRAAWEATARSVLDPPPDPAGHGLHSVPEQYLILVTCRDEQHQVELLTRFKVDGLDCRALVS